jgi:hypothetical protein
MYHICGGGEVHAGFWWGNQKERDKFKDLDVGGSSRSGIGGLDWIDLAQDRDIWGTLLNSLMNLLVP